MREGDVHPAARKNTCENFFVQIGGGYYNCRAAAGWGKTQTRR